MVTEEEPHHRPLIGDHNYVNHDYNHWYLDDQGDHGFGYFWQQMNIVFIFQVNGGPHRDCTGDVSLLHLFHSTHWVKSYD